MSEHTPGPWSLEPPKSSPFTPQANNRVWPSTAWANHRRDPICQLSSQGAAPPDIDPEAQANARLIAAAPELLAALKSLIENVETGSYESTGQCIADCRAVIAKAEGNP